MDYGYLKTLLKDIQSYKQRTRPPATPRGLRRKLTLYRAFSGLTQRHNQPISPSSPDIEDQPILVTSVNRDGSQSYETTFLMQADDGGEYEFVYFRRLDDEFNKVDKFYKSKVEEVTKEAEILNKQMDALIAFRENVQVQNPVVNNLKARKPAPLQILNRVKMNNTLATPRSTIKGFLNVPKQTELKFNRENLKKVEDQLKRAFVEFYQKLSLLKSYR
ncbi:hypothetical protein CRYUN_Cryun06bG0168700 [Craigia yunnanensis]